MHDAEPAGEDLAHATPKDTDNPRFDIQRILFWGLFLTAIAAFFLATILGS